MGQGMGAERKALNNEYAERLAAERALAMGNFPAALGHDQRADQFAYRADQAHYKRYQSGNATSPYPLHPIPTAVAGGIPTAPVGPQLATGFGNGMGFAGMPPGGATGARRLPFTKPRNNANTAFNAPQNTIIAPTYTAPAALPAGATLAAQAYAAPPPPQPVRPYTFGPVAATVGNLPAGLGGYPAWPQGVSGYGL